MVCLRPATVVSVSIYVHQCFNPSLADVNSWLVTFGFQLYNVIPGYRKPSTETMEPSYELVRTQIKTQEWDSTKVVTHLFQLSSCHRSSSTSVPFISNIISKQTCSV